jgi:dipeptidyl aminopeptidase/acylaminoacyl peptidase
VLTWLLVPLLIYSAIVALVWMFQSRMLFLPSSAIVTNPSSRHLAFEDVSLQTEDGETLHGWYLQGPKDGPTVLFFHGNAGNISHRIESLALLVNAGTSVFIVDYRGYGKSTGSPSEQGTYRDAETAWQFLAREKEIAPERIIIFGRSLGGGVASWLATQHQAGVLVLESTFESVPKLAGQIYPWLPVKWISRIRYDSASRVRDLETPTFVIHSSEDNLIGFEHGKALFSQARNGIEFVEMVGGHNGGFLQSGAIYRDAWTRIVARFK